MEQRELLRDPDGELRELAAIYERRGLAPALAADVATSLSRGGALEAHARDELGLDEKRLARPLQAAWTSAIAFASGAALSLVTVMVVPAHARLVAVAVVTMLALALLGNVGARLGGAPRRRATLRVLVWGAIAMAVTALIGGLVGGAGILG